MVQSSVRPKARCESCGRVYRVPAAGKSYACTECGGTVRSADVTDVDEAAEPAEDAAERRHAANDALRRAYRWIGAVNWLYRFGALAYATAAAFAVLALARVDVPREPGILVVVLTTLLSALMLMGAMQILFKPFVWTLVIAILATGVSIVHLIGPDPLGVAFLGSAAWALVAWAALVPTLRFRRLIAEHEELYILHHASARTRRSLKDRSPEERHERLVGAMHRAARRAWRNSTLAASALALATGLGTYAVLTDMRPGILEDSVERFETAWNASDLDGVVACLPEATRDAQRKRLGGVTAGHWAGALPELPEGELRREERRARIDYPLDGVDLATTWYLNDLEWELIELELPVPPIEPSVEAFRAAWSASDAAGIAELYAQDARAETLASLETTARERGWTPYPALGDPEIGNPANGSSVVVFPLERGEVETLWHLRADGTWGMHGLKLPRRRRQR